mmetsp:Transcript_22358/g.56216  ORF Transcript_22358/g.56216 Transcript_22358/m.56216 type:complete len:116 (-) Transcript_22358:158-505(-)|eukprot:jgi/Tetstr1/446763/TSEL_034250.t1
MAAFTMTASRPALASRAAPVTGLRARVTRRAPLRGARLAMRAEPSKLADQVEKAISDAEDACEGDDQGECATAWDEVEELSAAASHQKSAAVKVDPLDEFCGDNPDADECRIYED